MLGSLRCGVPMVAIPIANDQPGVAARVAWSGTTARVWSDPSNRQNARRLQRAINASDGVARAADIVEMAIGSGQPVL